MFQVVQHSCGFSIDMHLPSSKHFVSYFWGLYIILANIHGYIHNIESGTLSLSYIQGIILFD